MDSGKVRIYELSRELNLDNKDLLAICESLGISVKSHSSAITGTEAEMIRAAAKKYTADRPSPRKSAPVQSGGRKQQQILEIRRPDVNRPSYDSIAEQRLSVRRIARTGQGYIEPLLNVGKAMPLHMVLIPRGTFTMGSPKDEPERNDNESPQQDVTVPQFFMGRYPITQAQWSAVAGLPQAQQTLDPEPSHFKGKDNHPVEQVSCDDAVEFCARLEQHTKRPYRLPTEAEWEYACRADTTTPFYFGKTLTDELANYDASQTYAEGTEGTESQGTTAVDHFGIANAFGLSDLHGNVWEWCQDHWHGNYKGAPTDGSAWLAAAERTFRVLRGGSWNNDPRSCRAAYRLHTDPDNRYYDSGFRVCCAAPRTL